MTRAVTIYVFRAPVDMRKSFGTLAAALATLHGASPKALRGAVFFVGRDRRRAKVLFFDGTGVCLLASA
ncbi:MAG: IS66 family insertion sequence element accessory protein TnpB [Polyangiales bacterium]